jgi:hypothetical protein
MISSTPKDKNHTWKGLVTEEATGHRQSEKDVEVTPEGSLRFNRGLTTFDKRIVSKHAVLSSPQRHDGY